MTESGQEKDISFMLIEWEKSLGNDVPAELITEFGLIPLAADVLYEMTWLVSSAEEMHRRIEEFGEQRDC